MLGNRKILAAVLVSSLGLMVASVAAMALRVAEYHRTTDHKNYLFKSVDEREFRYAGRPVTITDVPGEEGVDRVVIRYGDDELALDPTIAPGSPQLPGLIRHRDWMQVIRFTEHGRASLREVQDQLRAGEIADRLTVVVRTPPPGKERLQPGQVFRKEWKFDLYEFKPEGGFNHEQWAFPKGRKPRPGELVEGTWQFHAALIVMPSLGRPSPKFTGDALPAMGWTLPTAAFSGLAFTIAGAALLAPRRGSRIA